jgi:hypothetical protein
MPRVPATSSHGAGDVHGGALERDPAEVFLAGYGLEKVLAESFKACINVLAHTRQKAFDDVTDVLLARHCPISLCRNRLWRYNVSVQAVQL